MKIMKSEVSFKSDVALVVVGQDANSEGFTGRLTVVPRCFNCRAALILCPGWGSCSKANSLQFLPWSVDFLQAVSNSEESNAVK